MRLFTVTGPSVFLAVLLQVGMAHAVLTHRYSFNDGTARDSVGGLNGSLMNGATVYSNFFVGRSQFSSDPFFHGTMDELRTYNNALTPTRIMADYQAGPNGALAVSPEPASLGLFGMAAFGLLARRRSI